MAMSLIELSAFRHAQSEISVIFALSDRPEDSSGFPPYAASCFPLRPQRHISAISAVKTIPNRYPREPPWNFPQPKEKASQKPELWIMRTQSVAPPSWRLSRRHLAAAPLESATASHVV